MIPARSERPVVESMLVRLVATLGVVGIGVAIGAILASQDVAGWIIGLAVSVVSIALAAVLWSSRRM
jgi:protein-S-isoprenylcysteine O-methyltransferase Ste14